MTTHDEGPLERGATPGPSLYFYVTAPERPRVFLGLLHGYGEHAGRYAHVADAWAEHGIATVAVDLRGHGKAEGRRGHCDRFDEFLDDAAELARLVRERAPDLGAIFFGHSFGGLVAASVALAGPTPWLGLALSSPFFGVATAVPLAKRLAGKVATRVAPTLALPTGLSGKMVTHDLQRARAYDEDPLVFKTATARWFSETEAAQERAIARAGSLSMPLLLVAGLSDSVVSVPRERAFFDAAGSTDKTWDGREGLFHEVLNEVEWRPIADRFAEWILARGHAG
jgi:alpha-beta hydrolase superfamily lysophospholipase